MTSDKKLDRYITFKDIDCDRLARRLVDRIEYYLDHSSEPSSWLEYFKMKLVERQKMGQDELFFVGSQVNSIRALFEQFEDVEALNLLDQVEEDCC
ncbi:MAG: N(2)-fixation sustaining protein CowN [Limnoraphis robusta]|uniref:N(2)-fixation sustaining protein CowN n=3 Tax=Limnoraphis TaxID=1332112 RepID=A0A0F5YFA0_9CYAN|nr:N(2)-fixation sustaining protein CowN [Limnoraphis robusta]KKD37564.1 N(2)-fixation sustaining protein CowN [Limnoraphis robusta CS-951]MEA5496810.1 N(2)-fixation sustaining protein CowN [Limnoraphis robusta BA-68 BA1]MEA5517604.1 N(2)-fixation sustaining protein CowN [Limnoraphis robusta CCNP1315]MEA5541342.1 N(2)-fixation sustaining protein CowN [Limnoraphis robusta Tam1]